MTEIYAERNIRDLAVYNARQKLDRQGNRVGLIVCLLICLLSTVAILVIVSALAEAFNIFERMPSLIAILLVNLAQTVLSYLLVFPMYLGLARLVQTVCRGESLELVRMFDYYASLRSMCRAWAILLRVFLPAIPIFFASMIASMFSFLIIPTNSDPLLVLEILLLLLLIPILLLVGFILTAQSLPFVMIMIDNPDMTVAEGLRMTKQITNGRVFSICAMRLRFAWRIVLSLLSIGVVTLIHVLPLTLLAYGEYAELLTEEVEQE